MAEMRPAKLSIGKVFRPRPAKNSSQNKQKLHGFEKPLRSLICWTQTTCKG